MTDETRPRRPRSWQEMRAQEINWLIERTGDGLETWNARVIEQAFVEQTSLRTWLTSQGVTGYPQMLLVMERIAGELIDGQYADRPDLRVILDSILALLPGVGEVEVQARKTYVALLTPKRTFGAVQPTTKKRVDLGLRLAPTQPTEGRLEHARNFGQSSVTHKIPLSSAGNVDDLVDAWLHTAYDFNS